MRWLITSGILASISAGGYWLYINNSNQSKNPIIAPIITVERNDIEITINESGTLELGGQQNLKSPGEVTVEQVLVRLGERVRAGEQLLVLRDSEGQKDLEILAKKGFIAGNELENAQEELRTAQATLKDAELDEKTKVLELQQAKLEQKLKIEQEDKVLTALAEVREAQATAQTESQELQLLQIKRQSMEKKLRNNFVLSPISGRVLDIKVKNGEGVKAGDVLLTLGDPAQEIVTLQLSSLDASNVKINQPARIKVIGLEAQEFTGRVQSLHPLAISSDTSNSRYASSPSQAKIPATIQLDKPSEKFIPGSQVSVEIIVQQRKQVPTISLEAIQRTEPKPFVWIIDTQGKAQKQNITLGLEGG